MCYSNLVYRAIKQVETGVRALVPPSCQPWAYIRVDLTVTTNIGVLDVNRLLMFRVVVKEWVNH